MERTGVKRRMVKIGNLPGRLGFGDGFVKPGKLFSGSQVSGFWTAGKTVVSAVEREKLRKIREREGIPARGLIVGKEEIIQVSGKVSPIFRTVSIVIP